MAKFATGVKIDGLNELLDDLKDHGLVHKEALRLSNRALGRTATKLKNKIKDATPKRTGEMRKTLKVRRNKPEKFNVSADIVFVGYGFHWRFHEYGTVREPARPFVIPTVERNAVFVTDTFRTEVANDLEKIKFGKQ